MNNPYLVGIEEALEDYPIVGKYFEKLFDGSTPKDDYKECLYLLLAIYKQYEAGKLAPQEVLWPMKKLCEILDY